jgi:glycosyltransferase involved in cell wall biosynthesis
MKLIYIANARIPTEKAHGVHIIKMCEALASTGFDVQLLLPRRKTPITADPYEYYGAAHSFSIVRLPTLDWLFLGKLGYLIQLLSFTACVAFYCNRHNAEDTIIYSRGEIAALLAFLMRPSFKLFWETHILPGRLYLYHKLLRQAVGIITVTTYYHQELQHLFPFVAEKLFLIPDGVDSVLFANHISKDEARKKLDIASDGRIVVYTGSDAAWKGLGTLKEAAALLAPKGITVIFVGKITPSPKIKKENFIGVRPYHEIPLWLSAADVVVLTGTKRSMISERYTSPMKLFEYMASDRPIVVSDVPSFRDILNEDSAYFVAPDDAVAMAQGIESVLHNPDIAKTRAARALSESKRYTWSARARLLRSFMYQRIGRNESR